MERESPLSVDSVSSGILDKLRRLLTGLHLIGAARMVDRALRRLAFAFARGLDTLSHFPVVGPPAHSLLVGMRRYDVLSFDLAELTRVMHALEGGGVRFWMTGGWGIDALVGCQTRRHADLDIVIEEFATATTVVRERLVALGYEHLKDRAGTIWFPSADVYKDRHGHVIEVFGVNETVLAAARNLLQEANSDPGRANAGGARSEIPLTLTTIGRLGERPTPALSLAAQRLFHVGDPGRLDDGHANAILELLDRRTETAVRGDGEALCVLPRDLSYEPTSLILVPVFDFPNNLWRLCRLYHNDLNLVPPHVTVAFPFMALRDVTIGVVRQLQQLFASLSPFDFTLESVKWFGSNVVYLEPSRSGDFKSITERLQEIFPAFHPYDGEFESIIPHVTLSAHGSLGNRRSVGRNAQRYLPITTRATHAWLMSNERDEQRWEVAEILPFGGL